MAAIGVIGLGYVGLPLSVGIAEAGHLVVAVDLDDAKVAAVNACQSYVEDITSERLAAVAARIDAHTHFTPLARADAYLICVPTPLTANREPDLSALLAATRAIADIAQRGLLIVLGRRRTRALPASWCSRCL